MMDFTESTKGSLLLFLAIIANFLGNTMNCSIQNLLTNSAVSRNVAIYFLIYFTVHFTSKQHHPIKNFGNAFFIYFLTSMYTDLHISEVDISAIAVNASAIT